MKHLIAGMVAIVCFLTPTARADVEAVAGDVWLGGSLFTVEDMENLDDACRLKPEQKEAALELMRGAMARARTMSLKYYRGWQDIEEVDGESEEHARKAAQDYQNRLQKQQEDVVVLEQGVMNDLKALLESAQADTGWQKFERSRRRLIVRSAHTVLQQLSYRSGDESYIMADSSGYQQPLVDVVAMVRATALSESERAAIADVLEPYEASLDSLITDWRPLARQHGRNMMLWWSDANDKAPSQSDIDKMQDLMKRMRHLQVRTARRIEDTLTGPAQERFQRQRLRRESRYRWVPARRSPDIAAVMRLRSLTPDQKSRMDALVKEADSQLLKFAIEDRHKVDDAILLDKEVNPDEQWGSTDPERAKQEARLRKKLSKDALAILTPDQRSAYDSGIENDQDLVSAFDKRRTDAESPWEVDADLNPWQDAWSGQRDDE